MNKLDRTSDAASTESTSPTGTTSSAGSKRKRGTESKFYSVRVGHKPGIYLNWQECLAQIKGFKGATFKSFASLIDAEKFLDGDDPTQNPNSSTYQPKFYGVRNGRVPGVYTDWPSAQKQIIGWTKPKHKCFASRAEAEAYVKNTDANGNADTRTKPTARTEEPASSTHGSQVGAKEDNRASKKQKILDPGVNNLPIDGHIEPIDSSSEESLSAVDTDKDTVESKVDPQRVKIKPTQTKGGVLRIYTDGSSLGNGKYGASAGVGVYFGEDDARNVSEPLAGPRQTNQRAELTAILRAIEIAPLHREVRIFTDSNYAIACVTKWYINWRRNNWRTSLGKPVENQDLVEAILSKIEGREQVGVKTAFEWIKGHAAIEGNVQADMLAVNGARSLRT
ncbi:hypothetical protein FGG08_003014 [Glutinoglossum americanum]|uniref:ribonuclease H n=1 Tax=Glutinoglossum americanum TaxID=1670608 RepID=A0A9P8I3I4_9PEZI|nr:hypothetical protein FGG08_003014 [Glutinoglossum americanum]